MNKKYFFIAIASLVTISVNSLHCMLSGWKKEPIFGAISPQRSALDHITAKSIKCRAATAEEKTYDCHMFTLKKTIGHPMHFVMLKKNILNIEKLFYQVDEPKAGDIVVYTTSGTDRYVTHSGIFCEDKYILSKWGMNPYIFKHKLFYLLNTYGTAAGFFRLKPEYQQNKMIAACKLYKAMQINILEFPKDLHIPQQPCTDIEYQDILRIDKQNRIAQEIGFYKTIRNDTQYYITKELDYYKTIRDTGSLQ